MTGRSPSPPAAATCSAPTRPSRWSHPRPTRYPCPDGGAPPPRRPAPGPQRGGPARRLGRPGRPGRPGPRPLTGEPPRLVVLPPVRNGAGLLDGWFAAVAPFADAVVALDDGSTDDTPAILESHPLVAAVLTHPRRTGFDQWDAHATRPELLRAAAGHGDWVLFLDADERIPAPDGDDLRSFVQRE